MPSLTLKKKTIKAFYFLHGVVITDFPGIAENGGMVMEAINGLVKQKGIMPTGPVIWVYDHIGEGQVRLKAGIPVPAGTKGSGPLKVSLQKEWACMTTVHHGSMVKIGKAWDDFTEAIKAKGLKPVNKNREVYLKWVGFNSRANSTELQMAFKV
jgi:effector-binding domain-containing protein